MEKAIAEALGLTVAEARVYVTLLELGPSPAGALVKKAALHRGTTYAILQRLMEKGLVSYIRGERKMIFEAQDPQKLLEILSERTQEISKIVPELRKIQSTKRPDLAATIFSGKKAIENVLEEMLQTLRGGGEYVDFGVSKLMRQVLGGYFIIFHTKRRRWNVKSRVIFDEEVRKDGEMLSIYTGEKRFFPKGYFPLTDTVIYNDKVILFIFTSTPPIAIVIHDVPTASSYRNLFEFMWASKRVRR